MHDAAAAAISDEAEKSIPKLGLINLQDSETKQEMLIDSCRYSSCLSSATASSEKLESQFQNSGTI